MSPITFLVLRYFGYIPEDLVVGWATKHRQDPVAEARRLWRQAKIFYWIGAACIACMVVLFLCLGLYGLGSANDVQGAFFIFGNAILGAIGGWLPLKASHETFYEFSMKGFGKDIKTLLEELNITPRKLRGKSAKDLMPMATAAIVARVRAILRLQKRDEEAPPVGVFTDGEKAIANNLLKRTYDAFENFRLNEWKGYGEYFAIAKA